MAENTVNNINAFLNRSGKRTHQLKELAAELGLSRTRIVKSGKTRWLSRSQCMTVLLQLFYALVSLFRSNSADDEVAQALYEAVTAYMFAGVVAGVADLLCLLATLSQSVQRHLLDYSTI